MKTERKPYWLKVRFPSHQNFFFVSNILKEHNLSTICQSAKCPNISECWSKKTATFLILGDTCTRSCGFCAVKKGMPSPPPEDEPHQVAEAGAALGLKYVVITSVTRDDLPDGGASHFAKTIKAIKERTPEIKVEVLIPDFRGSEHALDKVVQAEPDVINHNLETVESLYPQILRPRENYQRSLKVLERSKINGTVTKSGLMLGLGEKEEEILQTFSDLRRASCDLLTIGQYLQPTRSNVTLQRYYSPQEFNQLSRVALDFGFRDVEAGPLVRSSFEAHRLYESFHGRGH
jgi:lipoic acid synthetase